MGTSIHAMTPWFDDYQKFFFDEKYMVKCAGKGYYKFVKEFFDDHYFVLIMDLRESGVDVKQRMEVFVTFMHQLRIQRCC